MRIADLCRRSRLQHAGLVALLAAPALPAPAITLSTPTPAFSAVGQGVQVTPDWVLTVFHYALDIGQTYRNGYGDRVVAARYDAPGSGPVLANDLTLLRLAAAPTLAPSLVVNGYDVPAGTFLPSDVTLTSSANTSGPRSYAYSAVSESLLSADPDGPGPAATVTVHWLFSHDSAVYVQDGDSGGGLFAGHVSDSSALLGLASARSESAPGVPDGSLFVQPAAYRAWIDATMADDGADSQHILWVSAVPEPGPALRWLAGVAALAAWRQRRRAR